MKPNVARKDNKPYVGCELHYNLSHPEEGCNFRIFTENADGIAVDNYDIHLTVDDLKSLSYVLNEAYDNFIKHQRTDIVHCKDCVYFSSGDFGLSYCMAPRSLPPVFRRPDDFCDNGRKC